MVIFTVAAPVPFDNLKYPPFIIKLPNKFNVEPDPEFSLNSLVEPPVLVMVKSPCTLVSAPDCCHDPAVVWLRLMVKFPYGVAGNATGELLPTVCAHFVILQLLVAPNVRVVAPPAKSVKEPLTELPTAL